jgi:hypothetical protein
MNDQNLKPFTKGDKRINRKGRPKNFDGLRELGKLIGLETITAKDGSAMTRVELILRSWSMSNNYQLQKAYMEIVYGKVPDEINLKSNNKIVFEVKYADELPNTTTKTP